MRPLLCFLYSLVTFLSFAQTRKLNAETSVQNVTIFSSGAQVVRAANVAVQPGRSEIVFAGLSNQMEQQSVQLKADANITLLSVQTTKDYFGQRKVEEEERELLERRNTLKEKIELDNKLLQVYKSEEAMLEKNQSIAGQNGVKTVDLKEALDLQRQRLTEVFQKQLEIQKRLQAQQAEFERLRAQLSEISKKKMDSVNYSVTAMIDSKETRNIRFSLMYTIKDAGWYPTYDVRVADVAQPLNVLMNANVFQRSGETWKDVELFLSTGNPGDNATPSSLQPWMLNYYDPSVAWLRTKGIQPGTASGRVVTEKGEPIVGASITIKGGATGTTTDANGYFKLQSFPQNSVAVVSAIAFQSKQISLKPGYFTIQLKEAANSLSEVVVVGYGTQRKSSLVGADDDAVEVKAKKEEIQTVDVVTQYQPTTVIYKIEEKYTLQTDGKTTTIGIKSFSIPTLYEYYTAPKLDPAAYLTAKIVNWQDYDLQSGEASLYFEGTFLGKSYIDLGEVSDTLSIALGKDNNVRVSRKLVKEMSSKKLIGSNRTESKQYETTIRNAKKIPLNIIVQDGLPVSVNKEIDVEDAQAPEAKVDKETGIATWSFTLQPATEKKLTIGYSVKYPKDKKVVVE